MSLRLLSATAVITPTSPQVLGAGDSHRPVKIIRTDLEANLLHLESSGRHLLFISLDLLYPGRIIRSALEEQLQDLYAPDEIFLAASHTHNAPAVDVDKPALGEVDPSYTQRVIDALVCAVRQMHTRDATHVTATAKSIYSNTAINRRLPRFLRVSRSAFHMREVGAGPNPHGPRDETINLIALESTSGAEGVIWNYACHPNSAPLPSRVDAHFPGVVRTRLRQLSGNPHLPVVYLQGFSGDVRPPALPTGGGVRSTLRKLRLGPVFRNFNESEYASWNGELTKRIELLWESTGGPLDDVLRVARCDLPLSSFARGGPRDRTVHFHAVDFGPVVLVGVSGEIVTEYAQRLQSHFPTQRTFGVGCIDDTFGYVPTTDMLGTGGYEDSAFCPNFSLTEVVETVEDAMMQGFAQLAAALRGSL